jgi:hypothetical protein
MNGSQLRKGWKHWRKSPPSVCPDKGLYRDFLDSPTFDLASPKAIQTQAIIRFELIIKKGKEDVHEKSIMDYHDRRVFSFIRLHCKPGQTV